LSMRADDDGFINKPKSIMREVGCKDDDLKILASKKFLIPFESGVVVIKHWKIHNYIAKDRYTETKYKNEKAKLILDENNSYTECIQLVDDCETQVRLGKVRLGKVSIEKPTMQEINEYQQGKCPSVDSNTFFEYYDSNDWQDKNGKPVKNWKLKMLTWHNKNVKSGWLPPVQPKKEYRPSDDPVYAEWLKLQEQREAQE